MYLDWSYWTELELVRPQLQWWGSESALRSLRGCWDSSWCWARSTHSQSWVCDKTKVAGIGTVVLQNRLADSEAGGSGAGLSDTAHTYEFNEEFFLKSTIFFMILIISSTDMISNMISPMKRQKVMISGMVSRKLWILKYQEVSCQRIHIRIQRQRSAAALQSLLLGNSILDHTTRAPSACKHILQ